MKQQIITIIEKEEFITDLDQSFISIIWHSLDNKYHLSIGLGEEKADIKVTSSFVEEYTDLIIEYNTLLVMSDSDIVNFKNNLITLINNYFK